MELTLSHLINIVVSVIAMAFTAGGIYAAIKADIRRGHEKAGAAQQTAERAHIRLDDHLSDHVMMTTGNHPIFSDRRKPLDIAGN
jgi:hypothetical protein